MGINCGVSGDGPAAAATAAADLFRTNSRSYRLTPQPERQHFRSFVQQPVTRPRRSVTTTTDVDADNIHEIRVKQDTSRERETEQEKQ